jgi:hypothetical protein
MNNGSHHMYQNWNQVPVAMPIQSKCRSMLHWETHLYLCEKGRSER